MMKNEIMHKQELLHSLEKLFEGKVLTATEKIKLYVMCKNEDITNQVVNDYMCDFQESFDSGISVDELYSDLSSTFNFSEGMYDFRCNGIETDLPCSYSRHYESESVATQVLDGSWVGWTYWYGGGKHGEPESVEWLEDAYNLDCEEEEQVVIVRTFSKAP